MQRTKVFAVLAAILAATAAAVVLAGSATAAEWHVYKGDLFAGHAYGLQVPPSADSVEFVFDGPEGALASLGVYAPAGDKVGVFTLSPSLTTASVANPDAGQYVVYVYDISEGALTIRVDSKAEPALDLAPVALARTDTTIGTFPQGRLDQVITTDLKVEPVFATLLYEGSSKGLDATVTSDKGAVVSIVGESASAFSPGVWTSLKGERSFDASNLEGSLYTVEVHAAQFEGTMVLTTLALDVKAPAHVGARAPVPAAPSAPGASAPAHRPMLAESPAIFGLKAQTAVAFDAPPGLLILELPMEQNDDEEYGYHARWGLVTLYAPDDSVLAVIELSDDEPIAEIELPVAGEYVAFTNEADDDVVLATLVGARVAPQLRVLETAEEIHEVESDAWLAQGTEASLLVEHVPLSITMQWSEGSFGALASVSLENENGAVASTHDPVLLGSASWQSCPYQANENFATGEHTLRVDGITSGTLTITVLHFVRGTEVVEEIIAEPAEPEEPAQPSEPSEPGTPPGLPVPPVVADIGALVGL